MVTPEIATLVLMGLTVLLLVIIPLLDGSKHFGRYISLRYTMVAVAMLMAVGCVLDFSHLMESSRNITITGGLVLAGLFVIVRSLEKVKIGGKSIELEAHKGDIGASAKIKDKDTNDVK